MAHTAGLVCLISTVSGCGKKRENALEDVALVAGTQQNLSNLYSLDIYVWLKRPFSQHCIFFKTMNGHNNLECLPLPSLSSPM
jgi:hypothetical protein